MNEDVSPQFIENSPYIVLRKCEYDRLLRWDVTPPTQVQYLNFNGKPTHVVLLEDDFGLLIASQPDPLLHLTMPDKCVTAYGTIWPDDNAIMVYRGSQVGDMVPSFPPRYKELRERLENDNVIGEVEGRMTFKQRYWFDHPSTAASIITGHTTDGYNYWKDEYDIPIQYLNTLKRRG